MEFGLALPVNWKSNSLMSEASKKKTLACRSMHTNKELAGYWLSFQNGRLQIIK